MTLLSRLDALEAAAKAATPGPFAVDKESLAVFAIDEGEELVTATHYELAVENEGLANAEFHAAAVNLAPSLSAIARAAVARPWWRGGFEDDAGFDIWRCDGCDAPKDAPGDYAPHREPCLYSALDAAIDAAEGTK